MATLKFAQALQLALFFGIAAACQFQRRWCSITVRVAKGIDAGRMTAKGFGPDKPLVPNDSDANKQKNRRIEFVRTK